jgi:glucan biosynthesis protein C
MIPHKTERLHALDSLRAIMMLLGLVLHTALTYSSKTYGKGWPIHDPTSNNEFFHYLMGWIHMFRMPIFFVVAGFFGAMLFYERSPLKMLKNRINRIGLPFLVFLILLYPSILFSFDYTIGVFEGNKNVLANALAPFSSISFLQPEKTFHLWFLYYLGMITLVSIGLGILFNKLPRLTNRINKSFNWIFEKPLIRILFLTLVTFLTLLFMNTTWVATSTNLLPDQNTFIFYLVFYLVGWVLFKSKHLLNNLMRFDWLVMILAITFFNIKYFYRDLFNFELKMLLNALVVSTLFFGITGLFLRYGSKHSARMRYISDASYWIYLIHLPLTIILPALIADWDLSPFIKFLIVLGTTTLICVITYHYFVRATFIGKFLNGKKYARKLSEIKEMKEFSKLKPVLDK